MQRILISNNVIQGLKPMFLEINYRELLNTLPDKVDLLGFNADQFSIMMKNISDAKEYLNSIEKQFNPDMKVPTLTGTNFE